MTGALLATHWPTRPIKITRKPLSDVEAFLAESVPVVATYAVSCQAHNLVLQALRAA
jgi:hypothetical protein